MPHFSRKSRDIGLKRRRNTKECLLVQIQMVTVKLALCVARKFAEKMALFGSSRARKLAFWMFH